MDITYKNVTDYLLKEFPGIRDIKDYEEQVDENFLKLPYYMMALFVNYTMDLFRTNGPSDPTVRKFFAFVNEQFANSRDEELLNLLAIEVFENYAQEKETLKFARSITNEKARFVLESTLWWTGVDKPDPTIAPEAAKKRAEIETDSSRFSKE